MRSVSSVEMAEKAVLATKQYPNASALLSDAYW